MLQRLPEMSNRKKSLTNPDPEWRRKMIHTLARDQDEDLAEYSESVSDVQLLQHARNEIPTTFFSRYLRGSLLSRRRGMQDRFSIS